MEGNGTDMDLARDYFRRVDRIDEDVNDLKRGQAELTRAVSQHGTILTANSETLKDIAHKLDETRTQKPPLWTIAAALFALFGAVVAYQEFIFTPYQAQVAQNNSRIRLIESNRYTSDDARHDLDKLQKEIDAELRDVRIMQRIQAEQLLQLERNKADK